MTAITIGSDSSGLAFLEGGFISTSHALRGAASSLATSILEWPRVGGTRAAQERTLGTLHAPAHSCTRPSAELT